MKKRIFNQDNHDGVITHLEPYVLECEVKWALESITTDKASGGDGIPVELFQILKDDAVKVPHSICLTPGSLRAKLGSRVLVNIHGINTSTVADFKPPMQYP